MGILIAAILVVVYLAIGSFIVSLLGESGDSVLGTMLMVIWPLILLFAIMVFILCYIPDRLAKKFRKGE